MSDVSGIPNMGFGGGNFFAPQFSYNPQLSAGQASAAYMPAENYSQNVTNNLFSSGGGFGRLTDYYSQQVANSYGNINANYPHGLPPAGTFSDYNAGGDWPSGGGRAGTPSMSSLYNGDFGSSAWNFTNPSDRPAYQAPWDYSGGSFNLPAYMGDFQSPANNYNTFQGGWGNVSGSANPFPGMSMPGGLGSPMSGGGGLDWSKLWGGGGGARADPAPGMAMPGGLGSPMSAPKPPDLSGGASANPYPGMAMPGGLNSPMAIPEPQAAAPSVFDTGAAPIPGTEFAGPYGGGMGVGGLGQGETRGATYQPPTEPNRYQTIGPQATAPFERYFDVTSPYDPRFLSTAEGRPDVVGPSTGAVASGGLSADDMAAQARDRLAKVMSGDSGAESGRGGYTRASQDLAPESTAGDYHRASQDLYPTEMPTLQAEHVPLPEPRPAGADAQRPPDKIDNSLAGRREALATISKELEAQGLTMTSSYRGPEHPLSIRNPTSSHTTGLAFDTRAQTTEQGDAAMGKIRELFSARGMVEGRDYTILDEVRSPSGHATAPHIHTALTEAGMAQYQRDAYGTYQDINPPRPPADIPNAVPLPAERPAEAPAAPLPAESAATQAYPGTADAPRPPADIPPPAADNPFPGGVPLPAARPNAAANLSQAHSLLDSNVRDLVQKQSPADVSRIPSSIASQSLREALGNTMTGGMIRSGIEPYLSKLGVTPAEFDKAIAQGRSSQAQPPRFFGDDQNIANRQILPGELSANWNKYIYEATNRPTMARDESLGPDPNPFKDFRPSENVIDRREDPALSSEQRKILGALPWGYTETPAEIRATPEGGKLGEALGTAQVGNIEANAAARRMATESAIAREPASTGYERSQPTKLSGDPFEQPLRDQLAELQAREGDTEGNTFGERFPFDPTTFQSPANDYSMFQQSAPQWQTSIPSERSSPSLTNAIYKGAGDTGLNPAVLSQVFSAESNYDPKSTMAGNYGLPQLSADMWADAPFRGAVGGLTFEQFKNATPEQQINTYVDFLNRSGSLTRGGLDPASMSPETQFAYLMANQIGGHNATGWRDRLAGGDMSSPVYTGGGQAEELGNLSIGDMEEAYRQRAARW